MKRLIAIVIAVIAILVMSVPAVAVTPGVTTQVNIGGGTGGNPPFVMAKFETPDEPDPIPPVGDGKVNIFPEAPAPPWNTVVDKSIVNDGWKQINYYLVVDDPDNDIYITGVDVIVSYPGTGLEKYNLHVSRVYPDWIISGGPAAETYPTTPETAAPVPVQYVRELKFYPGATPTWDKVDGNADGDLNDPCDLAVPAFLTAYGSRVKYGPNPGDPPNLFTRDTVVAALEERDPDTSGKAIMLELVSYIWCHQDPVEYTVSAVALASEQSDPLVNTFFFMPQASVYLDFTAINWGNLSSPAMVLKEGDRVLGTSLLPTIWDNGNIAGQVSVSGTKMIWDTDNSGTIEPDEMGNADILGKYIDCFDAHMDYIVNGNTIQQGIAVFTSLTGPVLITDYQAGDVDPPNAVLLPPCTPTQIDFSIIAPSSLMNGKYLGTITITIANYTDSPAPGPLYVVGPGD
jgi:hypothetical protein